MKVRKNSLRLPYYNYRRGWFLITTNTWLRQSALGVLGDGELIAGPVGAAVAEAWLFALEGNPGIDARAFQLMPEHVHAVAGLDGQSGTLGHLVGNVKSRATRLARQAGFLGPRGRLWQRGYHARWLPDAAAVSRAVAYVEANPSRACDQPES